MRPSIMSLGATMSAPARAWLSACSHQRVHGLVVEHVAVLVDQPVLPVRGVRVERDVGDHAQVREARLQRAHRALHQAFLVPGRRGIERLGLRRGHRKQRDRRDAQLAGQLADAQQLVDRHALDAGHRGHRRAAGQLVHEHGVDQVIGGQDRLAHETARELVAAHPPRAHVGIAHGRSLLRAAADPGRRRCPGQAGLTARDRRCDASATST